MRPLFRLTQALVALTACLSAATAKAQTSVPNLPRSVVEGVVTVSGDSLDHLRMNELAGKAFAEGILLRSTSSLTDPRRLGMKPRLFSIVLPQVTYAENTRLPFGQNDGALWAGVGANVRALAGFTASFGPVRLVAIPELTYYANQRLPIDPSNPRFVPLPNLLPGRAHFSLPWNQFPYSIDAPWRFGTDPLTKLYPGQSSLTVVAGPLEAGVATENEWWGPAIRNPIVMSDNAAGFPHALIRTSHAVSTFLGRFDARWIIGELKESPYFDNDSTNNTRSLSAIAVTWKRSAESGLTLGVTRSVFSSLPNDESVSGHVFDALKSVGHPDARSLSDHTMTPGSDQIMSLFARWALPLYGLESYVEWGRSEFPANLRDFFVQPDHSRGYTVGTQWVHDFATGARLRLQGEVTNEEQTGSYRFRPQGSFYTSRSVVQGYTNYGQVIGSGIGPGSSSQWIAGDYFWRGWQGGFNVGRTRFNNDAYFLLPFELSFANQCAHDVTFYPGLRGGYANNYFRLRVDYAHANRYNTFFQNRVSCAKGGDGSDRVNRNLTVTLSTFAW